MCATTCLPHTLLYGHDWLWRRCEVILSRYTDTLSSAFLDPKSAHARWHVRKGLQLLDILLAQLAIRSNVVSNPTNRREII